LHLPVTNPDLKGWQQINKVLSEPKNRVRIALVGKYVDLKESYKSLHEALVHGAIANGSHIEIDYIDSESLNSKQASQQLSKVDGILVPGGFGHRGVEGKLTAIRFAREKKIPFLGICFGMQLAAIEYARHVCGVKSATSREFWDGHSRHGQFIIDLMAEQRGLQKKGGTMRLGSYRCDLISSSIAGRVYGEKFIFERHRHRFEFNNQFLDLLAKNGMVASGTNRERDLVEILEIKDHPWFVGVQFHPEFQSKPLKPHPLFKAFVKAANKRGNR
jgi:CTP synthase